MPDDDSYWDVVWEFQRRRTEEVLFRAQELCRSRCAAERRLGADILRQFADFERAVPRQCLATLFQMLHEEKDPEVLAAILTALGHFHDADAIGPASRFRTHADPRVRHGVVQALMGHEDQQAIDVLIELSRDEDAHTRDWATFGLADQTDLDTPALRQALAERLIDSDFDTRSEAIVGLAKRRDPRVIPEIVKELTSDFVSSLAVEAAESIAAPELYPHLVDLQNWWDVDKELLADAITACAPSQATGE